MGTPNNNWVYDTPDYRKRAIELVKKFKHIESAKTVRIPHPEQPRAWILKKAV